MTYYIEPHGDPWNSPWFQSPIFHVSERRLPWRRDTKSCHHSILGSSNVINGQPPMRVVEWLATRFWDAFFWLSFFCRKWFAIRISIPCGADFDLTQSRISVNHSKSVCENESNPHMLPSAAGKIQHFLGQSQVVHHVPSPDDSSFSLSNSHQSQQFTPKLVNPPISAAWGLSHVRSS